MKLIKKITIVFVSLLAIVGLSLGIYFGVQSNEEELPKFSQEEVRTRLVDDAEKFYDKLSTINIKDNRAVFKDNIFYFETSTWYEDFATLSRFTFSVNKLFGYNFTISFFEPPELLTHENLIVFTPDSISEQDFGPLPCLYYECHSFDLYLIYSINQKITFSFENLETNFSISTYEFETVKSINNRFYYKMIDSYYDCSKITTYTFKLFSISNNSVSYEDIPVLKLVEKPKPEENMKITTTISSEDNRITICYTFTCKNFGEYKFSITDKNKKSPFGYFVGVHRYIYCYQ